MTRFSPYRPSPHSTSHSNGPSCFGKKCPRFLALIDSERVIGRRREVAMTNSKRIAGLVGPSLVALTLTELINLDIWTQTPAVVVYLSGTLLFVAGLSIVRVHNHWTTCWPVLVTIIGWFALLAGLARMMAPEFAQRLVQHTTTPYPWIFAMLAIGGVLTVKAYRGAGTAEE